MIAYQLTVTSENEDEAAIAEHLQSVQQRLSAGGFDVKVQRQTARGQDLPPAMKMSAARNDPADTSELARRQIEAGDAIGKAFIEKHLAANRAKSGNFETLTHGK